MILRAVKVVVVVVNAIACCSRRWRPITRSRVYDGIKSIISVTVRLVISCTFHFVEIPPDVPPIKFYLVLRCQRATINHYNVACAFRKTRKSRLKHFPIHDSIRQLSISVELQLQILSMSIVPIWLVFQFIKQSLLLFLCVLVPMRGVCYAVCSCRRRAVYKSVRLSGTTSRYHVGTKVCGFHHWVAHRNPSF